MLLISIATITIRRITASINVHTATCNNNHDDGRIVAILKIVIVLAFEGLGGSFKGSVEAIYSGSGLWVLRVALRPP